MKIEKFKEHLVAFDFESETVNATDLMKAFPNKRMNDFLKLDQTKKFIEVLKSDNDDIRVTNNEILTIVRGNFNNKRSQGTWMHRILALKFAAWLSPEFELFVYKSFDTYLKNQFRILDEKFVNQQRMLDYYSDRDDISDIYPRMLKV
jgi:hypothetical protein